MRVLEWLWCINYKYFCSNKQYENGKKIEITAPKNSDDNRYVQKMTYNGKNYTKNYLDHFELLKGARLGYEMGSQPATNRGVNDSDFPYSFSNSAE